MVEALRIVMNGLRCIELAYAGTVVTSEVFDKDAEGSGTKKFHLPI